LAAIVYPGPSVISLVVSKGFRNILRPRRLVHRTHVDVPSMYRPHGRYRSPFYGEARHERRRRTQSLSERRGRHVTHSFLCAAVHPLPLSVGSKNPPLFFRDTTINYSSTFGPISTPLTFTTKKDHESSMIQPGQPPQASRAQKWDFPRQSIIDTHQGNQPLTADEATQRTKDAWTQGNDNRFTAWNAPPQ
jgi:hypothetical protein